MVPDSVDSVVDAFARTGYVADRGLAVTTYLGLKLGRPLFLEGEAGVGKTEVAKVLSSVLEADLIRLQCYEGLDASQALYEWDYARQMLAIRLIEARGEGKEADISDIMSREFLRPRPLLQAIEASARGARPVLLIDELDRADEEFEAYLLELLSDFQVTLPEIGTIRSEDPPVVVITSNRTREIHDALKRRCLYHWLDYPTVEREIEILRLRMPGVDGILARQLALAMADLRSLDLFKPPGVAETLDWAAALKLLNADQLEPIVIDETLGAILKYREDIDRVRNHGLESLIHS
ncbi:MAG: MoxR family ATPase [Actinobacteria bacterium]|nr:MoxR family ATPase [Actinomycetota bacterium]